MSELGLLYFFERTEAKKAVMVFFVSLVLKQGIEEFTSSACESAGALPALMHPTALKNSSCVCAYTVLGLSLSLCLPASYLEV